MSVSSHSPLRGKKVTVNNDEYNIKVAVRCRPLNQEEKASNQASVCSIDYDSKSVNVSAGPEGRKFVKSYQFDSIFGTYSTQKDVFEEVAKPILDDVLKGVNCSIFAYGQTGTGKTHTIEGDINNPEEMGIVPRSVQSLFDTLASAYGKANVDFTARVSFLEIYNEELSDLLSTKSTTSKKLALYDDAKKGTVCNNLEEINVTNANDVFELMSAGILQRQVAATLMNKYSSRSHTIFTIKLSIKTQKTDGSDITLSGQLNLIDLAGSESVARTHANDERVREAGSINQSLLTLGRVIKGLVENSAHVPYRDSKITRLLRESLGGKAKTAIIATFSPVQASVEETLSTLDYAYRARLVKNQPVVNQKLTKKLVLHEYLSEIEILKNQLLLSRESNGAGVSMDRGEHIAFMNRLRSAEEQLVECEKQLKKRNDEFAPMEEERQHLRLEIVHKEQQVVKAKGNLRNCESKLKNTKDHLQNKLAEISGLESVVTAQVTTERTLHKQGSHLQDTLDVRETDVDRLLNKVNRMTEKEEQRIKESGTFVSQMVCDNNELVTNVQVFQASSKQHSVTLCQSVTDMVSRGKASSEFLSGLIEKALGALNDDAASGQSSLASSCGDLKNKLTSENGEMESTLKSLQTQLRDWVSEADGRLKEAQNLLKTQQTELDSLVTSIENNSSALKEKNETYLRTQKTLIEQSDNASSELRKDIETSIHGFIERAEAHKTDGATLLSSSTQAFESDMSEMLDSMVLKAAQSNAAFTVKAGSMRSELNNLADAHSVSIQQDCATEAAALQVQLSSMTTALETLQTSNNEDAEKLSSSNKQVEEIMTVTKKAGEIKLADTTCLIIDKQQEFSANTELTKGKVDSTLDDINKMTETVNNASDTMQEDVSASLQTLTATLGEDGKAVSQQSAKHLEATQSHATEQQQGLNQSNNAATAYDEKIVATKLEILPADPVSLQKHSKVALAQTADHAVIRKSAQSNLDPDSSAESDTENESAPAASSDNELESIVSTTRTESVASKSSSKNAQSSTHLKLDKNAKSFDVSTTSPEDAKNARLDENHVNLNVGVSSAIW